METAVTEYLQISPTPKETAFKGLFDNLHSLIDVDFMGALRELPPYKNRGFNLNKYERYCRKLMSEHKRFQPFKVKVAYLASELRKVAKSLPTEEDKQKQVMERLISLQEEYTRITSKEYLEKSVICDINTNAVKAGVNLQGDIDEESGLYYERAWGTRQGIPVVLWQQHEAFIDVFCEALLPIKGTLDEYIGIYRASKREASSADIGKVSSPGNIGVKRQGLKYESIKLLESGWKKHAFGITQDLIDNKFIQHGTKAATLSNILTGEKFITPVIWVGDDYALTYFLRKLLQEAAESTWKIAAECFRKEDGLSYDAGNLRKCKTDKLGNEQKKILDKCVELLKTKTEKPPITIGDK